MAGTQQEIIADTLENSLATKQDILDLRRDMLAMVERLRRDMQALEYRMTIKLGGLMVAAVGLVATLVKIL